MFYSSVHIISMLHVHDRERFTKNVKRFRLRMIAWLVMSRVVNALLSIIEAMVNNPASILILLGFMVIFIGFVYAEVWIIALGLFMSVVGIVAGVGKGKQAYAS